MVFIPDEAEMDETNRLRGSRELGDRRPGSEFTAPEENVMS